MVINIATMKKASYSAGVSESMKRIRIDLNAFLDRVDVYLKDSACVSRHKDTCEAAYEGLYKLIQRIKKELSGGNLSKPERKIGHDIAQDKFLLGLLQLRTIAAHIVSDTALKQGQVNLYMPLGQPVSIDPESAGAVFAQTTFSFRESDCGISQFRHPDFLEAAKARIEKLLFPVSKG